MLLDYAAILLLACSPQPNPKIQAQCMHKMDVCIQTQLANGLSFEYAEEWCLENLDPDLTPE
ncbi:MAG: hypothetical protein RLY43_1990 [Bacteroidota bacterium]|jgi:hypothetical protein